MEAETRPAEESRFLQYVRRKEFRGELVILGISILLSRIAVVNTEAPFALAFLSAVAIVGLNYHYALIGILLGLLALRQPLVLPAISACGLFYVLFFLWTKIRRNADRLEKCFVLLFAQLVLIPVFYIGSIETLFTGAIGLCVSMLSSLVIQNALHAFQTVKNRHVLTDGEQVSISAFFGMLVLSAAGVRAYGFSLAVVLLLLFSMIAALARGIAGVAVSVALGAVLTIGGDFTLTFVGSLAACTLAGAALRKLDSLGVLGGFVVCSLVVGTYVYNATHTINLLNLGIAGVIVLLIPHEKILLLCSYLDADKNRERYAKKALKRLRDRTAAEMRCTASVCRELAGLYHTEEPEPEPTNALMQWTAQAAYGVCLDCPSKKLCWRDVNVSAESIYAQLAAHEKGERIRIRKPFDPSCKHMTQMIASAWQAQNQYLVNKATKVQNYRHFGFINRQLLGVCGIMETLARRVEQDRWLDEELEQFLLRGLDRRRLRVFGVDATFPDGRLQLCVHTSDEYEKDQETVLQAVSLVLRRPVRLLKMYIDGNRGTFVIEEAEQLVSLMGAVSAAVVRSGVSGDSIGECQLDKGRVLYVLSDGMGAGEPAHRESEAAVNMLIDLYGAGFPRDLALESVNKLLLGTDHEMYATLDAVFIDLHSGTAEFIKYGAPPTFIYRAKNLHTVCAEALPAGILDEAVPAVSTTKLRKNDAVILLSDGTLDALGDHTQEAICTAMADGATSRRVAEKILKRAQSYGQEDDMTVMVIKIA